MSESTSGINQRLDTIIGLLTRLMTRLESPTKFGIIVTVDPLVVNLDGSLDAVLVARRAAHYNPSVGDLVALARLQDDTWCILGRVTEAP